jgi:DNA polymerase sigma
MSETRRYHFESFERDLGSFDTEFSDFLNMKYGNGWKYKDCQFSSEGGRRRALCLFKRS